MSHSRRYSSNTHSNRNRLSDRDMLVDLINTEKHLSHLYEHAIMESSNITVRNAVAEFQHDEHENAYTLFQVMQERGWYNPDGQEQNSGTKKAYHVKHNKRYQPNFKNGRIYNGQYIDN
ncbi:spore coat protein [Sporomusa termitida]|uniref:Coat F domain protein n=1 Tax=Sporomusa termitida TaxID=2377 RepID=A0A517DTD4_9FIRM|nr:spore coat protein [Sporomusa termitida]QDR80623.1 Coat F domain protein [Sporomusa termitida]